MSGPVTIIDNNPELIDPLLRLYDETKKQSDTKYTHTITGDDSNVVRVNHGLPERDIADVRIFKIHEHHYNDVFKYIPSEILSLGEPKTLSFFTSKSGSEISTHIDRLRRTALNIYLSDINSKTIFYNDLKPTITRSVVKYEGREKPSTIKWFPNENDLVVNHVYEPVQGDIAILNVRKPHSVNEIKSNKTRVVLTIDLPRSYDNYINII
jgi:hypothetical protein